VDAEQECWAQAHNERNDIMNQRTIFRWVHIILSIPIVGYIYSPFEQIPNYARPTRFFFVPVMVLSGLWMWKGHVLRRLIWKGPAKQDVAQNATSAV
jgi:thiosulfate reductase cytochrome b subunit